MAFFKGSRVIGLCVYLTILLSFLSFVNATQKDHLINISKFEVRDICLGLPLDAVLDKIKAWSGINKHIKVMKYEENGVLGGYYIDDWWKDENGKDEIWIRLDFTGDKFGKLLYRFSLRYRYYDTTLNKDDYIKKIEAKYGKYEANCNKNNTFAPISEYSILRNEEYKYIWGDHPENCDKYDVSEKMTFMFEVVNEYWPYNKKTAEVRFFLNDGPSGQMNRNYYNQILKTQKNKEQKEKVEGLKF